MKWGRAAKCLLLSLGGAEEDLRTVLRLVELLSESLYRLRRDSVEELVVVRHEVEALTVEASELAEPVAVLAEAFAVSLLEVLDSLVEVLSRGAVLDDTSRPLKTSSFIATALAGSVWNWTVTFVRGLGEA